MARRNPSRRNFLKTAAVTAGGLAGGVAGIPAKAQAQDYGLPGCGSVWERPPKQQGNDLNLIVIVSDTFRHDNLACYGKRWLENLETPNLDRFAENSIVFNDYYPEGMPTVVIRRTLYTGRRVIPCYYFAQHENVQLPGWHQLYNEDQTMAETLKESGYISALVCDLYHLMKPGRNFQRGFDTFQWIRGQESDLYGTSPHGLFDVSDMVSADYMSRLGGLHHFLSQYKANRQLWKQEGESISQITAQTAIRWLKSNFNQRPFYLHVEIFDSHEPWDPPERFLQKYWKRAYTPSFIEPPYPTIPIPAEIKNRFRANYAGEVSCVDYWIGQLLDSIKEYGLLDNSVVVFMSDHGAMLGEHGQFLKGPDKLRGQVTHIPLIIHTPGGKHAGKKVSGFVQVPDLMPSLLHLLGLKPPPRMTGQNFWPLVTGEAQSLRDHVVQTYGWIGAARTAEWNYSEVWQPEAPEAHYHVRPDAPAAVYKPQLYDLQNDPDELTDVADRHPDVCRRLSALMKDYINSGKDMTYGSFNQKPAYASGDVYVKKS